MSALPQSERRESRATNPDVPHEHIVRKRPTSSFARILVGTGVATIVAVGALSVGAAIAVATVIGAAVGSGAILALAPSHKTS